MNNLQINNCLSLIFVSIVLPERCIVIAFLHISEMNKHIKFKYSGLSLIYQLHCKVFIQWNCRFLNESLVIHT